VLEIRIAGREILGGLRDEPYGLFVKKDGFQGWQGIGSRRREALSRAVEHGEHDVPVFLGSRVVTIDGWAIAATGPELEHLCESVTGIGATGARERVTVRQEDGYRWADGRVMVAECTDSGIRTGTPWASFQLQIVFADPRRYGETRSFPSAGTATSMQVGHYGNFPAYPVIEIPSAPSSYTIQKSGLTFTVSGATAGGTHTVDLRRGRVYRNGVEMPGVGTGDLWTVAPGSLQTATLSVPGVVKVTDTYI
jgi:hypothetical protein